MDNIVKDNIIEAYNKRTQEIDNFYKCKKYMVLIDDLMEQEINNQDYSEPDKWTTEIDTMFDFLFDNAAELIDFEDEVVIEHKGKYLELFEMHGQGCFKRICPVKKPNEFVSFKDIVCFEEFKKKPMKSEVLNIVNLALESMEVMSNGFEMDIDFNQVKDYLRLNLK